MTELPIARHEDLIIEEIPGETLVYDFTTDRAHCLNQTAALIWKNCDGQKTVAEIACLVGEQLKSPIHEQVVELGLEELAAHRLLREDTGYGPGLPRLSRRQLVKRLGLTAAIGLPLIASITAPTAAHAQSADACAPTSGKPIGCTCSGDSECSSFNCNVGVCGPEL